MRPLLTALLLTLSPALAQTTLLRPLPLSAACERAGYSASQDRAGTLRVLRYARSVPDNTLHLRQYYSAAGRLQSVQASAGGFAGRLYDLTARANAQGQLGAPVGYRSRLDHTELGSVLLDPAAVRAGRCP